MSTVTRVGSLVAPFRGLAPFGDSELDALLFFGRERETEIAVANLLAARLTILYGPSGVGKSSLLRAGVARRVRELAGRRAIGRGPDGAVVVFSSWADEPVAAISDAIAAEVTSLVRRAVSRPADGTSLADVVEHWTNVLDGNLYLVLDQLEEYFVYHDDGGTLHAELPDVVLRPRLRANVMLSLRDDALAQLDVFKGPLPGLFSNYLRLDRLDRAAASAAIRGPVERWNTLVPADRRVEIEPALVEDVLDQAAPAGEPELVEAPYLQLVLERLWNEEEARGSSVLRASTLADLGGASVIVRDHLERALSVLAPAQQDAAARMFEHLVTPSGTKVAHTAGDLAEFARVPAADATSTLAALGRERILRPLDDGGGSGDRYEIFHDVLGDAILGWRRARLLARERARAQKRQRRLVAIALVALAAALVMAAVTAYALSQRSHARQQTKVAEAATLVANRAKQRAQEKTQEARDQTALAKTRLQKEITAESKAKRDETALKHERDRLKVTNGKLVQKTAEANAATATAQTLNKQLSQSLVHANSETDRANGKARVARAATTKAQQKTALAAAQTNLSRAQVELTVDPAQSVAYALDAAPALPRATVPVLRDALVQLHERRMLGSGSNPITSIDVSSDGKRLAAAQGATVNVYSAETGVLIKTLVARDTVRAVAISADGSLVAGATRSGPVDLWSASSGTLVHALGEPRPATSLAFSSDGTSLASGGLDQAAKVWDTRTGLLRVRFALPRAVRSISFNHDGSELLVTEGDRFARVFPLAGAAAPVVLDQVGGVTSAEFSPDGSQAVTTGRNDTTTLWDARTGARLHVFAGHFSDVTTAAFSPDGRLLATASADNTARVWDMQSFALVSTIVGHTGLVRSLAWSPDDRFVVTASTDGSARVWEASDGFARGLLLGHAGAVDRVAYAGPDTVVTMGADGTVRLWNPHDQPALRFVGKHTARVVSVAFALEGRRVVSASADGTAAIWPSTGHGSPLRLVHSGPVAGLVVSGDGRSVLTWSADGTAALWAAATGRRLAMFTHGAPVTAAAISANGAFVATAGGDTVKLWDGVTGGLLRTLKQPGADAVSFAPDGRVLATGGSDRALHLWRVPTGAPLGSLVEPAGVSVIAYAPDGKTLAAATLNTATVWTTDGWHQSFTFTHTNRIRSLVYNRTGSRLLSGSLDGTAQLWSVRTRRLVEELRGHFGPVSQAALSADGRWAVTAGPLTAGVWPTQPDPRLADNRLFFLRGNTMQVLSVAFSPAGWRIATGDADGSVRVYDCQVCGGLKELERIARARLAALHR